jgi:hypothetical protein
MKIGGESLWVGGGGGCLLTICQNGQPTKIIGYHSTGLSPLFPPLFLDGIIFVYA